MVSVRLSVDDNWYLGYTVEDIGPI